MENTCSQKERREQNTYSDDIQSVVAYFPDLAVFVVHQIYEISNGLWRRDGAIKDQ